MANEQIDAALITQFSDQIHEIAQQTKSRLRPYVEIRPMKGEIMAYDGLGTVEASQILGRVQPVAFDSIDHLRRRIERQRFAITLPIDAADVRGMLLDPAGLYAQACVRAMERVFDRIVVGAQFATVYTGREMTTSVSASTDGVATVTATGGLTYAKLLSINQGFIDADVGNDVPEEIVMGIAGNEYASLMQETELVDSLYSRSYAVESGRMMSAAGIKLIQFAGGIARPILPVASSVRSCFAMSKRAICIGMSKEFSLKVEPRADLYETTQVQIVFDLGGVRTEGKLLQKVTTTAS